MNSKKTQEQIEKDIIELFPNLPQYAVEVISYITATNNRLKTEIVGLKSNISAKDIRLKCLELALMAKKTNSIQSQTNIYDCADEFVQYVNTGNRP